MRQILLLLFVSFILTGCGQSESMAISTPAVTVEVPMPTATPLPSITPTALSKLSVYAFPDSIDPAAKYLFYLHGKIIEDQGIPAVSPDYGEYEYEAILQKFVGYGFTVISEQRPKNTDGMNYAKRVSGQVTALLDAGVPAKNITVVGASKGGGIAIFISDLLENEEVNFVIMGACHPDDVKILKQNNVSLFGNILTIRDSVDEFSGACGELFASTTGLVRHNELVLHIGSGHGILYQPLDEWVLPAVQWASGE
jgi:hypothetical protein